MNNSSFPDKEWIRSHLPEDIADQPVDFFTGMYLEGLTVKHFGEWENQTGRCSLRRMRMICGTGS